MLLEKPSIFSDFHIISIHLNLTFGAINWEEFGSPAPNSSSLCTLFYLSEPFFFSSLRLNPIMNMVACPLSLLGLNDLQSQLLDFGVSYKLSLNLFPLSILTPSITICHPLSFITLWLSEERPVTICSLDHTHHKCSGKERSSQRLQITQISALSTSLGVLWLLPSAFAIWFL